MGRNLHDIQIQEDIARERRGWRMNVLGVYKGETVDISLSAQDYKRYKRTMFLSFGAVALMHISAGFINNPSMFLAYIAVPYVGGFAALVYWLVILLQLPKKKDKFRLGEEKLTFNRMKNAALMVGALAAFGVGGEIYLFQHGGWELPAMEIIFLVLLALEFIGMVFLLVKNVQILKKL